MIFNITEADTTKIYNPQTLQEFCNANLTEFPSNSYIVLYLNDKPIEVIKYKPPSSSSIISVKEIRTDMFGPIKPKNNDLFQRAYIDSLFTNSLTLTSGPAGSGKTALSLAYCFLQLEKGKVDHIYCICNPYKAQGAVSLGFMPGSKNQKLLDSSIGNILISKIGDLDGVQNLLDSRKLILLPIGDARGFETSENSIIWVSEAQNYNIYLMKLLLQRINDNCQLIIEGDNKQVDHQELFGGDNNGMKRLIEVFSGEDYFSHIELKNIYRGKIAAKAEEM